MSGEANCLECGRALALLCRACDVDTCDQCLQLPKARRRILELEASITEARTALMASPDNDLHALNVLGSALTKGESNG